MAEPSRAPCNVSDKLGVSKFLQRCAFRLIPACFLALALSTAAYPQQNIGRATGTI